MEMGVAPNELPYQPWYLCGATGGKLLATRRPDFWKPSRCTPPFVIVPMATRWGGPPRPRPFWRMIASRRLNAADVGKRGVVRLRLSVALGLLRSRTARAAVSPHAHPLLPMPPIQLSATTAAVAASQAALADPAAQRLAMRRARSTRSGAPTARL